ncbi:MAG: hypothetical protein ACPL7M_00215 [Bryobacteraceae bacterium]
MYSLLRDDYARRFGCRPNKQLLEEAIARLRLGAEASAPQQVFVRVGAYCSGPGFDLARGDAILVDRGFRGGKQNFIVVDAAGVRLQDTAPVVFRRPKGTMPLPIPELDQPASVRDWLNFLVPAGIEEESKIMIAAYCLGSLMPLIPQPHLLLVGPQGSGKSRLARSLVQVLDPASVELRRPARDEREFFIALHNRHIVAFDNVSQMPRWLADGLCSASSGTGFAVRQLYSDANEVQFTGKHGCIITSICPPCLQPDFLDRVLLVELKGGGDRLSDLELDQDVQALAPFLRGALLRALQHGLQRWHTVYVPPGSQIRLFDLQRLLLAASSSPFLGWTPDEINAALRENQRRIQQLQVDWSPILYLLVEISGEGFCGRMSDLLKELEARAPKIQARRGDLPRSTEELARTMRYLEGPLRAAGVIVERRRGGGKSNPRLIVLRMA